MTNESTPRLALPLMHTLPAQGKNFANLLTVQIKQMQQVDLIPVYLPGAAEREILQLGFKAGFLNN